MPALAIALVLRMVRVPAQAAYSSGVVRPSACGAGSPAGTSFAFLAPQGLPPAVLAVPVVALVLA